ncbi:hypothetical protein NAC44_06230 [Allorhizobium sp. BGMRC 0089]|uniref:hypothetical protein n=1 Tax=Allorhizobium sonneratiae TaxID=2934936 RepID=UPI0020349C7F|nr:hypothetical protein [Allorhizobium sonneratiae]MCM2291925.1 hypothetical protein [Allorhizobium sonneratiae]
MVLSKDYLASSWRFVEASAMLAGALGQQFQESPRLSRSLVSHQRWLITHAAFALAADYLVGKGSGLTASGLKDWMVSKDIASRNTVLSYVDQYLFLKILTPAVESRKRPRRLELSPSTIEAMQMWFSANLMVLDYVDGGGRLALYRDNPDILLHVQPEMARRCIADDLWREPPKTIGILLWTESGALVMDELMIRVAKAPVENGYFNLGFIDIPAMAERFMMSRTHLQRSLKRAEDEGCVVRQGKGRHSQTLLSPRFLQEYRAWLAIKASILDEVLHEVALERGWHLPACGLQETAPTLSLDKR